MTNLMLQLLELTVSMSVLIAFILLFFKLFGKKFTSKCKYIVWTIVILRLCLPVGFFSVAPLFEIKVPNIRSTSVNTADTVGNSEISIPNTPSEKLPSNNISGTISPDNNMQTPTVNPDITPNTPSFEPDTPVLPNNKADNSTTTENIHTEFMPSENETEKKITHIPSIEIIPVLLCSVWAAGAVLFIGARLIPYAVYVRRMKKVGLLNAPSEEANAVYDALCRKIGVKRPPKLLVSRVPISPHLCGFIRRKIIIPDMTYAMNDIESILSHELTHCKRGDLYVKLACTAAQAVNWFNPLVHLASGKCVSEMELSCDEAVLKNSNEEERILYGNAMLDIVRRCGHVKGSYMTSDFKPKRGAVKERIMNIINSEKKKKGIGIIAAALALCITAGTVIGCSVAAKESAKEENDTKVTETEAPEETEPETAEPEVTEPMEEDISQQVSYKESESYLGKWYVDRSRTDSIEIKEISAGSVKFESYFFRTSSYTARAVKNGDEFVFGNGISEYENIGPVDVLKGRLKFEEDGITVTYDSFGENTPNHIKEGDVYYFKFKPDPSTDQAWAFANAFKSKDISGCALSIYSSEELVSSFSELLEPLSTLNFSAFSIYDEIIGENGLPCVKMDFTVSESGYDLFPEGEYEATLYDAGPEGTRCDWKKPNDYIVQDEYSEAVDFINVLLPYMVDGDFSSEAYQSNRWAHEGLTLNIYKELSKVTNTPAYEIKLTPEEMKNTAYELYGIEDFEPHERNAGFGEEEGVYTLPGHGGDICYCDVININKTDDIYEIDVQYYADTLCFGKSNVVRYTLRETNTRFGYRLEKNEIIEAGKRPRITSV